ncbi:protein of unknown function [Legionella fallonii LLAP-10]|uniref:Uncharacterized protein n=1 Tax=Legionella fallonii LLAP-10 TaxID=1212491 RepID=A0A098G8L6_9GAMM|nr:protein of unknown function [Legionella fallonii LLAP-10]
MSCEQQQARCFRASNPGLLLFGIQVLFSMSGAYNSCSAKV